MNWPLVPLAELAEFRNGVNYDRKSFGSGVRIVAVSNFQDFTKPRYAELEQINPDGVVSDRDLLHEGDILFVRSNGNRALIGRSLYISKPPEPVTHSAFTIRVRFTDARAEPRFFAYLFRTPLIRRALEAHGGGTNISNLSQRVFAKLEVPLPSVGTQRRITGILSAYDDLIENCERRIRVLDEMARAFYREWFVLFRYPGHEKTPLVGSPLGRIPKGWAVRPVKDLATVIYGFAFKSALFSTDSSGRTPVIRIRDIPVGASSTYTSEVADQRYEIENGDILVGMDGDFHMTIWSNGRALQNQRVARFRPAVGWTSLQLLLALERPIQALNTAIVGTTVAHLGDMHIRDIQLVEPSAEVLTRSRALFEPIELESRTLQQKVRNLCKTRDLLLPRLISGQISVEEAA